MDALRENLAQLNASLAPHMTSTMKYSGEDLTKSYQAANTVNMYEKAGVKMDALNSVFDDFHKKLELETELRRDEERHRFKELKEVLTKIERNLASEIKRRVEANKAMQSICETEIATLHKRLETEFFERTANQKVLIENVTNKICSLETVVHQQNEARIREIQEVGATFLKQLAEFKQTFEIEKNARVEREAVILKRLGDEMFRVRDKLDKEKEVREYGLISIQEAVDSAAKIRAANIDKFQGELLEEISGIKSNLHDEVDVRERTEDQIIDSLNKYVTAFRDGIKIVTK